MQPSEKPSRHRRRYMRRGLPSRTPDERSGTYLHEAQKLSRTGSFGWNVASGELFWSEEAFRIFGYEPAAQVRIEMVLDRVHPDDLGLVRSVINRAIEHKEAFDFEHRLQMPDGSVKYLHVAAHALPAESRAVHFAGAVMDVTARMETEQALRSSEKRYQSLFQAMDVSLWELDYARAGEMLRGLHKSGVADLAGYFRDNPDATRELLRATRVVDVNDQSLALFGRGDKQELLADIEPYWPEESWGDYIAAVESSFTGSKFSTETRLRRLDGTIFDAHLTTWYASEDRSRGLIGITDITARKQAFARLEASEQRYRNLFHHMPVALWQLNAQGILELFKQLRSEGVTDLGAYFDSHPGLVQRCMEMLKVEEVNERTVQMLGGHHAGELVGTSVADYFPKNSPTFRRSMISRYRGDPNYAAETRLSTLDGRVVDVLYTASRVGQIGEPGMSLLGVIDITERNQAEEALRRSERRYQNMFQAMAVAFFEFDFSEAKERLRELRASGVTDFRRHFRDNPEVVRQFMRATRIVEVNDHTVALVGGGSSEGLAGSVEPFWPEESTQAYAEVILSALERKQSFSIEARFRRVDGSQFDGHFTVWYSADQPTRGLAGVIDITARKQAFSELEKSEQRYRLLFHGMPAALWQIDSGPSISTFSDLRAQGVTDLSAYMDEHPDFLPNLIGAQKFEEVNDYAVRMFGARDRSELIGTSPWTWLRNHDTLRRALESRWRGEEFYQETTKLVTRYGGTVDALFTSARPQNLPITLVGAFDLTKQIRAEEELQRVRADFAHAARISMLGELTASIAHEVNQPLAAIAAGGEASLRWLGRPTPDVEVVRELTRSVVADARRASEIIARIRTMATRRVPEQVLLSLDDVIRDALVFLRHEMESRKVTVSHFPASAFPQVLADRTQLQQVVVNLAVNGIQAIAHAESGNRSISIRTLLPDPATLRCSVEDSGPGIEPRHAARLFDSFFTTKDSGMGMGLRICRSVIEAHGGRIEADNNSTLGGARFSFTLPVAGAPPAH